MGERKKALIIGRLQKVLRKYNFDSFSEYFDFIENDKTGNELLNLIDHISTNHTYFYREKAHFEELQETVLPQIHKRLQIGSNKKLKIWVAGCSTGEEPYTIAMILLDFFGRKLSGMDTGILATDISKSALEKSAAGIYKKETVTALPKRFVLNYFDSIDRDTIKIKDSVRKLLLFRRLNLIADSYPFRGKFDIIFCRNVMIYFDNPTRQKIIDNFSRYMESDGYLFIGHSESIGRNNSHFKYIKPAEYRKF